jgi:pSer/pThr/pTyr-binding forkhead associated (FHA) protein
MQVWPDVWLADGDSIVLAKRTLQFRERLKHRAVSEPDAVPPPVRSAAPPSVAMLERAMLTVEAGPLTGRSFPLAPGVFEIGRAPDCAVSVPDDTAVSRKHARLEGSGTAWRIVDGNSANGTFVNERRLESGRGQALNEGDRIRMGTTVVRFDQPGE